MINKDLECSYPCTDVQLPMIYPETEIDTAKIKILMISEAPVADRSNYFYKELSAPFFLTTAEAFKDAGLVIKDYNDLENAGIYLTTAIKCSKLDYLVSSGTIDNCCSILEKELSQFPNVKAIMCMGDFAIKAISRIYRKKTGKSPIRPGSTYRIRNEIFEMAGIRFFPSYTQTGDSFNIEKSKRRMIAEDIRKALEYVR